MSTATKTEEEKKTAEAEDTRSKYRKEADAIKEEYDKKLTEQADAQKAEINTQIDQQITNAENEMAAQRGTVEQGYRDIIDSVAVQREIDRRQISETMANLGLSRSGLSATQQTAVQLSAGNKTAAAQRQKQEAIDALTKSLAEYKLEAENTRRETVAGIDAAKEEKLAEYSADLYKSANEAETKDNETALKAQEQMLKANEAGLKALFDAKSIDALTYSAALSNGYSVQSLYEQGLVKQAGYYKVPDSDSGSSTSASAVKTLLNSGAIDADTYALALDNNWKPTQALTFQKNRDLLDSAKKDGTIDQETYDMFKANNIDATQAVPYQQQKDRIKSFGDEIGKILGVRSFTGGGGDPVKYTYYTVDEQTDVKKRIDAAKRLVELHATGLISAEEANTIAANVGFTTESLKDYANSQWYGPSLPTEPEPQKETAISRFLTKIGVI